MTSSQHGDSWKCFTFSHNQKEDNNQFKNKNQPQLLGNQTIWKSNNQGVKVETFIQTGRRGREEQLGWRGLTARQHLVDGQSHIHVWVNQEEKLGSETNHTTQGSSAGK